MEIDGLSRVYIRSQDLHVLRVLEVFPVARGLDEALEGSEARTVVANEDVSAQNEEVYAGGEENGGKGPKTKDGFNVSTDGEEVFVDTAGLGTEPYTVEGSVRRYGGLANKMEQRLGRTGLTIVVN